MTGAARAAAFVLAALAAAPAAARDDPFADRWIETAAARLEGLDKVTGRVSALDAPVGATVRFAELEIHVRACHRRPPELPPDSAAFLEIAGSQAPGAPPAPLFRGWMFASSPGLSALEHPTYDVILLDCPAPPEDEASSGSQSEGGESAGSE